MRDELWVTGSGGKPTIDEGAFAENMVNTSKLVCYNGILYDGTGRAIGKDECQKAIYQVLRGLGVTSNLANRVKNIYEIIKISSCVENIAVPPNKIAVQNGTLTVDLKTGEVEFNEEKQFSIHRLNCNFNPNGKTASPKRFLEWVNSLIHEYDINGFQEYLGYTLLPMGNYPCHHNGSLRPLYTPPERLHS